VEANINPNNGLKHSRDEILNDYATACLSRELSILGRKEATTGKAKFGIFGDGLEVAQVALARYFRDGDWRSGYYRDQTFMLAAGLTTPEEFFAQIYGDTNIENNPSTGGRNFNNHYSTRTLNNDNSWKPLTESKNSASDLAPTAGQIPRLLGLAFASKLFRNNTELVPFKNLSNNGDEVAFGTIGDGSTSEGHFWEIINAAGVLQVPLALVVWDNGYSISVPRKLQTTKDSISELLAGFEKQNGSNGILLYKVCGWDYPSLCNVFQKGILACRTTHTPVVFHVTDLTQPLGHSSSGSHERYKSSERMQWETKYDALHKMQQWLLESNICTKEELDIVEQRAQQTAREARDDAWKKFCKPLLEAKKELISLIDSRTCNCGNAYKNERVNALTINLKNNKHPIRKDFISTARKIIREICIDCNSHNELKQQLSQWISKQLKIGEELYSSNLHCENSHSAINITPIKPIFSDTSTIITGREIIRNNYHVLLREKPLLTIFGEDVGVLGGVNMSYEGLQNEFGELRVFDTGIRETAIIGQGIGMALRGMRPIAEIQYFDYILYALQTLSDDLACLHYRTRGGQSAPLIISTRGHRLEGIWHSGSPLSMVINSIRGIHVCVPRNMVQAAGMYNTLLEADDPALVIEPLNGYYLKERCPDNIGKYRIPLGIPEILNEGTDITLVTYGACVKIAQEALPQLQSKGISVELVDVQTLLPFDIHHTIRDSVKKTNRVLFFDEDVPGGATAFMMQKVLEEQGAYVYLDSAPRTLSAKEHRPAYSTDGDYFSNPNAEDVFEKIYEIMHEAMPKKYPSLY